MSHYFTAYILCGHVIWAVLAVRNRRAWLYLILAGVIVSGAFVAWLLTGAADGIKLMDAHNALWIQRAHAGPFPDLTTLDRLRSALLIAFVQHVMLQPIQAYESIFVRLLPGPAVTLGWALFTAALLLLAASNLRDVLRRNDWRERLRLLMLILAAMGPLMAGALALKSGHMLSFLHRYMVFSAPFAAIFLALCAATLVDRAASSRSAALVSLPLLTVMLVMTGIYLQAPDRFMRPPDPRGDIYFEAAGRVAEVAQPADLVVYGNAFDALMVSLYLRNRPGLRSVVEDHDDPLSRPAVMLRRGNSEIKLVDILYLGEPP
jgi:hypothetical protein